MGSSSLRICRWTVVLMHPLWSVVRILILWICVVGRRIFKPCGKGRADARGATPSSCFEYVGDFAHALKGPRRNEKNRPGK